jgi:hypothetical protein
VDAAVTFPADSAGVITGLHVVVGGETYRYTRAR